MIDMLFSKHAIYNEALNIIANEINICEKIELTNDALKIKAFSDFLSAVVEQTDRSIINFKLIVPFELIELITDLPKDIQHKIILKINLKACMPENYIEAQSLIASGYNIAVDIQDNRSINAIPNDCSHIILDSIFMSLISTDDKNKLDKSKLIIKNIENYETLDTLKKDKVRFFSGTFIASPTITAKKEMSSNNVTVLKLIATLNDPDVEFEEVSKIVSLDNVMSYKLLKVINSPLFRGVNELTSIQDAIIRFGYVNLKKWGLALSLTNLSDKPNELTRLTLERAIMCSNIAKISKDAARNDESFYTTGLFSTLDAFFDTPMQTILDQISLEDTIRDGILHFQGDTGEILKKVIDYQHGIILPDDAKFSEIYLKSSEEAHKTIKILGL